MLNATEIKQLTLKISIGVSFMHLVPCADYQPRTAMTAAAGHFEIYIGGSVIAFRVLRKVRCDHALALLEAARVAFFEKSQDAFGWTREAIKTLRKGGTVDSAIALMS